MAKRILFRILSTLICTLVFVAIAAAHEIDFAQQVKIGNGPALQPGTYRVEVVKKQNSTEVTFSQGNDFEVTVPATLTQEATKCKNTEVHSEATDGGRVIYKIWLHGWRESLVFERDTPKEN